MTTSRVYVGWIIAFLLGVTVAMVGITLTNRTRPAPIEIVPPEPTPLPEPTLTPGPMRVFVNGSVTNPGVYELVPNSIVLDAVEAAGGFGEEANTVVVNLAQPLNNGMQIYVPSLDEEVAIPVPIVPVATPEPASLPAPSETTNDVGTGGVVNINTASLADLDGLPGIGPSTAQKIIDHRDANGSFATIENIMDVSGIGEAKFNEIKDLITVGE
jgi:competence protein ComEA